MSLIDARTMGRQGYSMQDAVNAVACGWCDRKEYYRFEFLWKWGAPRFEGKAGKAQQRFENRFGLDALNRRIERTRRFITKYNN